MGSGSSKGGGRVTLANRAGRARFSARLRAAGTARNFKARAVKRPKRRR